MFRDLLSNRLIQVGLVFFVIGVGGSLLYSWQAQRTLEKELARHDRFLPGIKHNETRPAETENVLTENGTPGLVNTPGENTDAPGGDEAEVLENDTEPLDMTDAFLPDVEATLEEIIDEEEKVEEALSAEERRNKEGRRRLRNTFSKIKNLIASEGGKIDHTSSLSARVKMFHLQQDLFHLIEEGSDDIPAGFRFFMNLSQRMNNVSTSSGEFSVSEYVKVADYMDAEGDVETANRMRAVAQRALDHGDDIIKYEHFKQGL